MLNSQLDRALLSLHSPTREISPHSLQPRDPSHALTPGIHARESHNFHDINSIVPEDLSDSRNVCSDTLTWPSIALYAFLIAVRHNRFFYRYHHKTKQSSLSSLTFPLISPGPQRISRSPSTSDRLSQPETWSPLATSSRHEALLRKRTS